MRTSVLMLLAMLLLAATVDAEPVQPSPGADAGSSAVLPSSRQFDFRSAINGRMYRVQVAIPFVPAPQGGYAVLYVLDGDGYLLPVDASRDILFGHSLGGLFALHVLFTHPESFKTYLVLSPSIWFNNRVVLGNEAAFAASVKSGKVAPRVFVAVGGEEEAMPPLIPPGMTREQVEKSIAQAAMVHNARDLGDRLKALQGGAGYTARSQVFAGETHISVAWASVIPFLNFALAAPK